MAPFLILPSRPSAGGALEAILSEAAENLAEQDGGMGGSSGIGAWDEWLPGQLGTPTDAGGGATAQGDDASHRARGEALTRLAALATLSRDGRGVLE